MSERAKVSDLLRRFVSGQVEEYEFDDFLSIPVDDPEIEAARLEIVEIPTRYPPEFAGEFTSALGRKRLLEIAGELELR